MPVRVAVLDDYPVIVEGVAALLEPHSDLVEIVELNAHDGEVDTRVDVALFDTFAQGQAHRDDVVRALDDDNIHRVAMYTWNFRQPLVDRALRRGCRGYLSKGLTGDDLSDAIVRIDMGETVVSNVSGDEVAAAGDWPGRRLGLTERESEVLALATQGFSYPQIADVLYLSINSVKTHTRNLYRRVGVRSRTQAVLWGLENGFALDD